MFSALPGTTDDVSWLPVPDEALHVAAYAVLGATLAHARFHGAPWLPHVVLISIGAAYGVTDEWHQSFVPGRVPSVSDGIADVVGVVAGYGMAWLFVRALGRRRGAETAATGT